MSGPSHGEGAFAPGDGAQPTTAPLPPPLPAVPHELDTRRLSAPLPVLEAHRALKGLRPGDELRVLTSHAGALAEFQALARCETSLELLSQEVLGEHVVHLLRKRR